MEPVHPPAGLPGAPSPERLPTLTEVIELSQTRGPELAHGGRKSSPAVEERRRTATPVAVERRVAATPLADWSSQANEPLVRRVMEELQRQIDLMLEYRLRETIGPAITRATDNLVRELRAELASTLREVVARAVEQEVARHRGQASER